MHWYSIIPRMIAQLSEKHFDGRVIYDIEKMADELASDDNISTEEAMDFIDYNAIRSLPYAGEKAPVVVHVEY